MDLMMRLFRISYFGREWLLIGFMMGEMECIKALLSSE